VRETAPLVLWLFFTRVPALPVTGRGIMHAMNIPGSGTRFVEPQTVITHFHLAPGDRVADFGAGSGFFLEALSRAVGAEGEVYACEIQKKLVDRLGQIAHEKRLGNVHPLWCDLEVMGGTRLQENALDAGVLANTLFQIEKKDVALAEMYRVLRPGGKFFVIDWSESFAGLGPHRDHVVTQEQAQRLCEDVGFSYERDYSAGAHHYGLAFRRN